MGKGSNGLHFNCVSLVKRMIKDAGSVNYLPLGIFVFAMTNKQVLGGKSVGLNIYVCIRDVVYEGRFTDIREASNDQGSGVSVNLW